MRIFVAFAFRKEDRWISELVFPLITAFGHTVVTGEDLAGAGQGITDEVKDRIHSCDALIGFTTRRVDEITEQTEVAGRWPTHRWVQDELLYASASSKIPVVEVREAGVRDESGMLEDLQRINYEATARDSCLVNIAKVVGWWSRSLAVELKIFLPPELMLKVRPLVRTNDVKCSYEVRRGYTRIDKRETELMALRGHLIILLRKVEPGDLVQVQLQSGKEMWSSAFEPVDGPGIQLE